MSAGRNKHSRSADRKQKVRKAIQRWKEHRAEVKKRVKARKRMYHDNEGAN